MGFFTDRGEAVTSEAPLLRTASTVCPVGDIEAVVVFKFFAIEKRRTEFEGSLAALMTSDRPPEFIQRCEATRADKREGFAREAARALAAWPVDRDQIEKPN